MKKHRLFARTILFFCLAVSYFIGISICEVSAETIASVLDFQKYPVGEDLSNAADLDGWDLSNPLGNSGNLTVQGEETGNRYLNGNTYFQLKYHTVIKSASTLTFDIQRTGTAQLMACVKSSAEMFTFQNGMPSNLFEGDGNQWSHGASGLIVEFADYDIILRVKTVDDTKINGIANQGVEYRYSWSEAYFNTGMRHIKIEDTGNLVRIYVGTDLIWTVELSEPGSYANAKIAAQETYYKKAIVKDSQGDVKLTVDNAFVSVNNTVIFASDATSFKLDNISLSYENEAPGTTEEPDTAVPNPQTFDETVIMSAGSCIVLCCVILLYGIGKKRAG